MIPYIFHSSILLAGSFIFYWLFLRKETFFQLNRWILIGSIIISLGLPFLTVPPQFSMHQAEIIYEYDLRKKGKNETAGDLTAAVALNQKTLTAAGSENHKIKHGEPLATISIDEWVREDEKSVVSPLAFVKDKLNWTSVLWFSYIAGVIIFSFAFLIQFLSLLIKIIRLPKISDGKFRIVTLKNKEAPFSFLNCIFINPELYDSETYNLIVAHEKIHIEQIHFFDKLLAEVLLIAFWFNPFVWLYRNIITNNLEYLTDKSLLEKGVEKPVYQMSLLKVAVPNVALNLTTNYNHSFLKNRITMMNSSKSSLSSSWKYMALIPIFILSLFTLNAVEQQYIPVEELEEIESEKAEEQLAEQQMLKEEFEANSEGEALSILAEMSESEEHLEDEQYLEDEELLEDEQYLEDEELLEDEQQLEYGELHNHIYLIDSTGKEKLKLKDKKKIKTKQKPKLKKKEKQKKHPKIGPGEWEGTIENGHLCLSFNNSDEEKSWHSFYSKCFPLDEFIGLSNSGSPTFTLVREAGKMDFEGSFTNNKGSGKFEFTANQDFKQFLNQQGISSDHNHDHELFYLFINNVNKDYISFLKQSGFKVDMDGLMALSVHGIDKDELKSFMQMFASLNNKDYNLEDLVQFKIHNVTPEYINELRGLGMNLNTDNIVMAKIHNVEPNYIKSMLDYGFKDADMEEMVQFAIHNVSIDYIKEMKALGFDDLDTDEIVAASIHNVNPKYIAEVRDLGFSDLDLEDIIQFSIHNITAAKIKSLKNSGLNNLSHDDMIMAGIHNVDAAYIEKMKSMGFDALDMEELVQFAIHNVSPEYIKEFKDAGIKGMDNEDIIHFKIHGITVDYIQAMKAAGLKNLDTEEIVQFGIHNITPEYIKSIHATNIPGIDNEAIITAGIHHVPADYIKDLQASGLTINNMDEVVRAKIHGVSLEYIRQAQQGGFEAKDLDSYTDRKLKGLN